ncbi:MAG: hypothetical protein RL701_2052 [Pseudomonadota bacterium]
MQRRAKLLMLGYMLLVTLQACGTKEAATKPPEQGEVEPIPTDHPPIHALPDPELSDGHVGRAPRRITVAQLRTSIAVTTGQTWSQLDKLSASLGSADYALVNAEATEPNLVFAKFLEDGSREVCLEAADADLKETDATKRVLARDVPGDLKDLRKLTDSQRKDNLVYLSTRFWGQPLDGAELDKWHASFIKLADRAEVAKKRREAWGALCIAFMTDPRFVTY